MQIEVIDHSQEVLNELESKLETALEACALTAEAYAKKLCKVDTGRLRGSISHDVDEGEKVMAIGTDVSYASYVELGTSNPDAHPEKDKKFGGGKHNKGHKTIPNPTPFLGPAITNHLDEYKGIIERTLKGS